MIARNIDYNLPDAGYLVLAGFIWFILFLALDAHRKAQLNRLAPPELLSAIIIPRSPFYYWVKVIALILAWVFGCAAFMEPKSDARYIHTGEESKINAANRQPPRTLLLAIDASASMGVKDVRLGLSRLDDAKEIAEAIASLFTGTNIAIYAFTSIPTQLSPPTPDQLFVQLMLRLIHINEGDVPGTDYLESLKTIHDLFLTKPSDMQYFLIMISDGGDTAWQYAQGAAKEDRAKQILELIKPDKGVNFKAFAIGEGSENGGVVPNIFYQGAPVHSSLESGLLQQISDAGDGKYYIANQYSTLALAEQVSKDILQTTYEPSVISPSTEKAREESLTYNLYFQYPLALALVFLGIAIFLPDSNSRREKMENG